MGRRQMDEPKKVTPKVVHTLVFLVVGEKYIESFLLDMLGWFPHSVLY
jgi:hypothetical protein